MATHTEQNHTAEYLVSEANGGRAREEGVLATGQNLPAGAVLSLTAAGNYTQLAPAAADGTEDAKAVLYGAIDATDGEQPCTVHVRACEVEQAALVLPKSIDEGQTTKAMNDLIGRGVIPR